MYERSSAYFGFYIPFLALIAALIAIILLLKKEKGFPAFVWVIILVVGIPIWLDCLIFFEWYKIIPFESSRTPKEWMDFLGSYLGVVGTIIAGALAYWQTRVNRKQDQEIENQKKEIEKQNQRIMDLQTELTDYQIRPIIIFKNGILEAYHQGNTDETNKYHYLQKFYGICGLDSSDGQSSFIYMNIPFQEKGFIPVEKVKIEDVEWTIDGNSFTVNLDSNKYTIMGEQLQILIDSEDDIVRSGSNKKASSEMLKSIYFHQEFFKLAPAHYECSHLRIDVFFENQLKKSRKYRLEYFIFPERNGKNLYLTDPHIVVLDNDEENNDGAH